MASSSSRTRSSRPPSPASSTSSSHLSNRLIPRSCSTSASSLINSAAGIGSRSMTPSRTFSDSGLIGSGSFGIGSPVPYPSEELLGDPMEETISSERDSISVTVRFRPLRYARSDRRGPDLLQRLQFSCRCNWSQFFIGLFKFKFLSLGFAVIESIKEEMKLLGTLMVIHWSGTSTIHSLLMHSVFGSPLNYCDHHNQLFFPHCLFSLSECFSKFVLMPDKVFGPQATTIDVYDVAARPVVKAAMEGVNGKEHCCKIQLYQNLCLFIEISYGPIGIQVCIACNIFSDSGLEI